MNAFESSVVRHFPLKPHWAVTCSPTPPPENVHGGGAALYQSQKMELGNILNTKMPAKALAGHPMQYDMNHQLQHELQQPQHPQQYPPPYLNGRIKSETNSERGASPHTSDSRYAPQHQQPMQYPPMSNGYPNDMRYPSPSAGQMGVSSAMMNSYNPNAATEQQYAAAQQQQQQQPAQNAQSTNGRASSDTGPPKAFACSTCGKGFARRSDLARHGKIVVSTCSYMHLTLYRTYSQWCTTTCLRLPKLRQAVHPTIRTDSPSTCSYRREASHV